MYRSLYREDALDLCHDNHHADYLCLINNHALQTYNGDIDDQYVNTVMN
jgi:hypothetical protein